MNDDDLRRETIQLYINSITDYNNSMIREQARAAVKQVIDSVKKGPQQLDDTSNLSLIEAANNFPKEAPEFVECEKQVARMKSAMRNITKEKNLAAFMKAADDCYLPKQVVGAEEHLESFLDSVDEALTILAELETTMPRIKEQLESLSKLTPIGNED